MLFYCVKCNVNTQNKTSHSYVKSISLLEDEHKSHTYVMICLQTI